jgi:hypothetical protein
VRGALVLVAVAWASPTRAEIVRIEIDKARSERVQGGRAFGTAGAYERLIGLAYGELDPADRRNVGIQDLSLAPKNGRGMVEYVTTFSLTKPVDVSRASGLLFYESVNRSNELTPRFLAGGDESGDEFLMKRGAIILRSGWQGDIPADEKGPWGGKTYSIHVPVAKNPDGSSITGLVLLQYFNVTGHTTPLTVYSRPTLYRPATLDTSKATLTSAVSLRNDGVMGGVAAVPSSDWAFADCNQAPFPGKPDPGKICLKQGFDPTRLYQLVYTAKDPLVLGIGFAATRDVVSFFRRAALDRAGMANPVGGRVTRVIGMGSSQTGQFVRTFINLGFNEDEAGRVVWDGAIPNIAGRQLGLNLRFALPDGTATVYAPDGQGALWWASYEDRVRGHKAAGLLDRCLQTRTCPKIFETFGSAEFWGLRMSPDLVGTDAKADIPLPDNVRRYYSPSTTHGGGPGGFSLTPPAPPSSMMGRCTLPANTNPQSDTARALVVALDAWIAAGVEPPPSRYPRLADGSLVVPTKVAVGFPSIPGAAFIDYAANPQFDFDFGPGLNADDVTGVITKLPPTLKRALPALVPTVNADGNETSGVASVQLRAPLGTYLGWNVTASGFFEGQRCAFIGGFVPFARTKAQRLAASDPRPSIEERYGGRDGYLQAVRVAAEALTRERFLLPEDAERLVREAARLDVSAN